MYIGKSLVGVLRILPTARGKFLLADLELCPSVAACDPIKPILTPCFQPEMTSSLSLLRASVAIGVVTIRFVVMLKVSA